MLSMYEPVIFLYYSINLFTPSFGANVDLVKLISFKNKTYNKYNIFCICYPSFILNLYYL